MRNVKFPQLGKISWKLTFFYAGLFSAILIALSFGVLYGMQYFLMQEAHRTVQGSAAITQEAVRSALMHGRPLTDPVLLNEAEANANIDIVIADGEGLVVSRSADTGLPVFDNLDDIREVQGANHVLVLNTQVSGGGRTAYLQVSLRLAAEDSFLRLARIAIVISDMAGILLSLLAGFLAARRMLKPIDNITRAAREISITDLNRRIEAGDGDDELARLANTFNGMIERLRVSFEKQNGFVSDASHELRTPIAVIRGYIDMIDRWGKDDPSVLNEAISAIQNETHNMEHLVENLLFLARNDSGRLNVMMETFDLRELAEEIASEYGLISPGRVEIAGMPQRLEISADRGLIKQALRALVDNGIKFSPEGEAVRIAAAADAQEVSVTVTDRGIGIPPEMIGSIFERFYRVDTARERKTGGTGLGLSILQTIVQAHRGRIDVQSEPGRGTSVTILLPVMTI